MKTFNKRILLNPKINFTQLSLLLLCTVLMSVSNFNKENERQKIHVKTKNHSVETYMVQNPKKIKIKKELTYYWYKTRKIHATKGGYSGFLLDGCFDRFDLSNILIEQGRFKLGLKHGVWKFWFKTGELKMTTSYKKGLKHGVEISYDKNGLVISQIKYEKGIQLF